MPRHPSDDTPCARCGDDATHTHGDGAYCRPCWKAVAQPRRGPQPRGPDWAERHPEAADMDAQAARMHRQQGRTSGGRRF